MKHTDTQATTISHNSTQPAEMSEYERTFLHCESTCEEDYHGTVCVCWVDECRHCRAEYSDEGLCKCTM